MITKKKKNLSMPTVGIEPTIAPLRVECLTPWPSRRVVARFLRDVGYVRACLGKDG